MPLPSNMGLSDFIDIFKRKKWLIVFSFLLIFFVALVYCVVTPDLYKSNAKILIIPPSVSEGMVQTTVRMSIAERLKTIQLNVLGRAGLTEVIQKMGVSKLGFEGMTESKMQNKMRSRISLEADLEEETQSSGGVNIFNLAFLHENPEVAQEVTAFLSTLFMKENILLRESVTTETASFLERQMEEVKRRLEAQEDKLKRYKLQHSGELPQQEQSNFNQLDRLREQIKSNNDAILRLQDRRLFLESQASILGKSFAEPASPSTAGVPAGLLAELAAHRKKVAELKQKYTEKHPAVVQGQWELAQIEAQVALAQEEAKKNPKAAVANTRQRTANPEESELSRILEQIARIDLDITALKRESANANALVNSIQSKIERLPQREQEMISLTRDYENLKRSYDELLDKKLKASISKSLEETQKAERFKLIEPADRPLRPSAPNRLIVFMIAFAASCMIGVGGAFALEVFDPTLKESKEFKNLFSIPVLATLPTIHNEEYKRRVVFRARVVKACLVLILGMYVVFLSVNWPKVKVILRSIITLIGGGN